MLNTEHCEEYLDTVKEFAAKANKTESLVERLNYLDTYAEHGDRGKTKCLLFKDFAPYSFFFRMQRRQPDGNYADWFSGGCIFHGQHDGGGNGSAPTFSVCLTPEDGWSVHT